MIIYYGDYCSYMEISKQPVFKTLFINQISPCGEALWFRNQPIATLNLSLSLRALTNLAEMWLQFFFLPKIPFVFQVHYAM